MAPVLQLGDLPLGEGASGAQPVEERVAPELPQLLPTAREGEMEPAVGVEDFGGGDDVDVRVPEEKIAESLESHDEAGLADGAVGAEADPGVDGAMGGVVEVAEQRAVAEEERADEARHGEDKMPVGHWGADGVGDERTFDERAPLVAGGAEAALLAGESEEEFVVAVGAVEAGEAGVEVAAAQEGGDGGGGLRVKGGPFRGAVVENLPDRRGAGLAGAVAAAHHGRGRSRGVRGCEALFWCRWRPGRRVDGRRYR